jgi:hypothetical protein
MEEDVIHPAMADIIRVVMAQAIVVDTTLIGKPIILMEVTDGGKFEKDCLFKCVMFVLY